MPPKIFHVKRYTLLLMCVVISSCGIRDGAPKLTYERWDQIPDAIPTAVEQSRYGNPKSYQIAGKTYTILKSADGFRQKGVASWYGTKFHGRRTSSGEAYDMYAMTAAHKTLPIPVYVEVTNLENDRRIVVKVNDRGPFHEGRIIDLSFAAATKLGVSKTGTAPVKIRVVTPKSEPQETINTPFVDEGSTLYVHVASYATEKNAMSLINQLHDQQFGDVRIHVDVSKGKMLYRVRIGPLPTSEVAKKLVAQLKVKKYKRAKIINYL